MNWTLDLLIIVSVTPFLYAVYLHIAGAKYCPPFSPSWLWLRLKYFTLLLCYKQENRKKIKLLPDSQHTLTMKLRKPWTPEILPECYYVAREEPIRHEKTKEQAATIILLVCGFVACLQVLFFAAIGLNTINIPTTVDVQGVTTLTVW